MLSLNSPFEARPSAARSAARTWAPLAHFIAREARIGAWAEACGPVALFAYEFVRFGVKQAWACMFGAIMLALLLATHLLYPRDAALARYDFLVIAAVAIQAVMLRFKLETWDEARVILIFHVVGTIMEVFKTAVGSWVYPEPSLLRVCGVPLFTGFMYAAVGSYIARCWRLFDFRFDRHPPVWALGILSSAIYLNFFAHHYVIDGRIVLFAASAVLFGRSTVHYRVWKVHRHMPLLLGLVLVALFIWFAENIGTFSSAWVYPSQRAGWHMVSFAKLGSWFLLMIISYTLVASVDRIAPVHRVRQPIRPRTKRVEMIATTTINTAPAARVAGDSVSASEL
jgi:uncharacterized membrane protein YoaT (DUF817 family)